ncbi:DUF6912 family protein [Nocardiopsis kunsanensis]|uniref:Uncharacterized protein n=1 Tax=Nocardiopsis kunsanensis TaxID=141693 RepID=A0A919CGC5_9ACTN|nr:hypothetical protein [Nocardiopsis kunsanensis]GHD18243.1 hypothetical protein GCM10007147_08030 [Nocardiopsis kunsanensis]
MYVFLPSTVPALAAVLAERRVDGAAPTAFTADPAPGADTEEAEYEALHAAAEESLRLLGEAPDAPRRRVVLAAEVPDHLVEHTGRAGQDVARVSISGTVPYKKFKSAHVDDPDAEGDIAAAAADPASGAAEGHELMWYAVQELRHLVEEA